MTTNEARLRYSSEKLSEAVRTLAIHPSHVRHRLIAAAGSLALVSAESLPPKLRAEYEAIWLAMTRLSPKPRYAQYSSSVGETMNRIRNTTGTKIAERIVSLDAKLDYLLN